MIQRYRIAELLTCQCVAQYGTTGKAFPKSETGATTGVRRNDFSDENSARGDGQQAEEANEAASSMPPPKKSRTNTSRTPAEEQRLKIMRDAGNSWGEIAKVGRARPHQVSL